MGREPGLARDVRFISELIDKLEAAYNIDPTRIYANGLSNGGGMAFVLSCTLSDRIAAVGMVGAAQTLPWSWCTDRRPVPMIAVSWHGRSVRAVQRRHVADCAGRRALSERRDMGRELGATKPLRTDPDRIDGRA